ncbi:SpaA isopeptide-forming pilin-related protein [Thomasclavelia ramosa]|uniref:SpaA isopeptide-forming pilin-related protein n=1 Tax=Thomasclavelia ramosa TaxID=1547 RepID=UPI00355C1BB7
MTTNENGKANTPFLPYGQYLVKETVTPKDYITAPDFLISVSDDYTEYEDIEQIKRVNINNRPFTSQVKLIKVDKDTGKTVTLNSATFKIKDSDGNYVTQKIGGKKYDTFTTNSKNQITVLFGNKGEVTLPLALDAGKYTIEEVKTPQGFLVLEEPVHFTITNQYDYDVDEDKDPIITIKVKNEQPKGKIILKKTDKVTADPLEKVEYELTAKEDIINAIDGSILFKKGNLVAKGITNADGQIVIDDLFMGHYELKEVLTNEGYVLSKEVHNVVFEQEDLTTKEYVINVDVTNIAPSGEIHLVKTDKDNEELLSGVIYQLSAKENVYSLDGRNILIYKAGDTVSKDISQDGYYMTNELGEINISNLPLGKYQLKEITPLEGYYTDKTEYEIDLSYDHSDKVIYTKTLNVTNTKSTVEISKVDATNSKELLVGAHLSLYDKNNNLIEEWISTNEPHIIRGLKINEEYRLHEDLAPLGYATASDITFIVTDDTVTKVTMKDEITKIDISKVDATTNEEIEGAKLTVTDKETGEVVDSWTSVKESHRIAGLAVGKTYILHEELAPQGYLIANDVEFTVLDSGEVQKVVMKDELAPVVVQTGDSSCIELYAILAVLSLGTAALYIHLKKKKGNNSDE